MWVGLEAKNVDRLDASTRTRAVLDTLLAMLEDAARGMVLVCLGAGALVFLALHLAALSHPYPLDYGEAPLVDQALRLANGQNIYRPDLASPPYTVTNYPPLYVLVMVPWVKLFGPGFGVGRLISSVSALTTAVLLGLIIYHLSRDRFSAVVTGLLFLSVPYVTAWSALLRVDLLALACSVAALYALVRWPSAGWALAGGGLLLTAAIFARQSYALAAPLAAFVWLWGQDRRRALHLACLVGVLTLLLVLIAQLATGGGFLFHAITANANAFGIERLDWNMRRLWKDAWALLLLGSALLVAGWGRVRAWRLLAGYLLGAGLSALTIGKIGSNVNYFLELCAALSLSAGALLAWSSQRRWLRVLLLLLLALQTGRLIQTTLWKPVVDVGERRSRMGELRELEQLVAAADGPVLADEYMGMITLQGRPLYLQPFEMTQLARAGVWDQTPLVQSIEHGEFELILIHRFPGADVHLERWTQEMLGAVGKAYTLGRVLADTYVYRPAR
jgi:hypothetical protein